MDTKVSIQLKAISKKFNREWIFKDVTVDIEPATKLVILGGNGSGKSTLLQIISGFLIPDKGNITYSSNTIEIKADDIHSYISYASPYIQLTEEYTLSELVQHTKLFKSFLTGLGEAEIIHLLELTHAANKPIKHFSSGMKQRAKLGLAILADSPILLLDEPLSNLDLNGVSWYKNLMDRYAANKTVVVCSNAIKDEYSFCTKELTISNYK